MKQNREHEDMPGRVLIVFSPMFGGICGWTIMLFNFITDVSYCQYVIRYGQGYLTASLSH